MAYQCKGLLRLVLTLSLASYLDFAFASEISSYELRALEARRAIVRGQIEVEATYRLFNLSTGEKRFERPVHVVSYFDGKKSRNDEFKSYSSGQDREKSFREVSSFGESDHVYFSDQVLANGNRMALEVRRNNATDPNRDFRFDPRLIGMVPKAFLNLTHNTLESVVGRPDRRATDVEDVDLNGQMCKLVKYTRNNGMIARMWICPDKDHGILKIQTGDSDEKSQYVDTIDCALTKNDPSGKWFPESYVFTRFTNGKLDEEERGTVKVTSLNQEIASETFTLAGIGVPTGERVYRFDGDGAKTEFWDGKNIIAVEDGSARAKNPWSAMRIFWLATSVISLIILLGLTGYRRRPLTSA